MCPATERRRYNVTQSLIGWTHTQDDPCYGVSNRHLEELLNAFNMDQTLDSQNTPPKLALTDKLWGVYSEYLEKINGAIIPKKHIV